MESWSSTPKETNQEINSLAVKDPKQLATPVLSLSKFVTFSVVLSIFDQLHIIIVGWGYTWVSTMVNGFSWRPIATPVRNICRRYSPNTILLIISVFIEQWISRFLISEYTFLNARSDPLWPEESKAFLEGSCFWGSHHGLRHTISTKII